VTTRAGNMTRRDPTSQRHPRLDSQETRRDSTLLDASRQALTPQGNTRRYRTRRKRDQTPPDMTRLSARQHTQKTRLHESGRHWTMPDAQKTGRHNTRHDDTVPDPQETRLAPASVALRGAGVTPPTGDVTRHDVASRYPTRLGPTAQDWTPLAATRRAGNITAQDCPRLD